MSNFDQSDPDILELLGRYEKWREIYGLVGKPPPGEPLWENGRLLFRFGYPSPDWWAFVLEGTDDGRYRVLRSSTERSNTPAESSKGVFSRIKDAGKFMIYSVGESLRIDCRLEPLAWKWDDAGIDPQVEVEVESDRVVKYVLRTDPDAYFIMGPSDKRYSHILPLTYDQLDAELGESFSENVVSRLSSG